MNPSDAIHAKKIAFHAFTLKGKNYIAFREHSGTTIFDDQFNNYGSWQSLSNFVKAARKGTVDPVGKIISLSARQSRDGW